MPEIKAPIPQTKDKGLFKKWIGQKIKEQRLKLNLSQTQLIKKAGLNLHKSTLSTVESGRITLSLYNYMKIKTVLGKDLDI